MQESPRSLVLPRGLIFFAALWMVGSWMITIGMRTPVQPSSASYEPGVRLMLLSMTIGMMIAWPLLRLSQRATRVPIRQTVVDLLVLLALMQVVVWPLRLVTTWSPLRTLSIDLMMSGWLVLCGAIVAGAVGSKVQVVRNFAMLLCIAVCLLFPALVWLGALGTQESFAKLSVMSPLPAIHHLSLGGGAQPVTEDWMRIGTVGIAAAIAWVIAIVLLPRTSQTKATRSATRSYSVN